jgi:two-component system KDP operon response regulator KdpE
MPIKVLAIDDDSSLTALVAMLLRSQGFEVITANNGPDGIEAAKNESPDIVILDLLMPEVDGWAVCRSLRTFSELPIIVLSAIDNPGSVGSALDAGADDYLIKPVPTGVLVAHINNLTRRATAQRDAIPIGRQTGPLSEESSWASGEYRSH